MTKITGHDLAGVSLDLSQYKGEVAKLPGAAETELYIAVDVDGHVDVRVRIPPPTDKESPREVAYRFNSQAEFQAWKPNAKQLHVNGLGAKEAADVFHAVGQSIKHNTNTLRTHDATSFIRSLGATVKVQPLREQTHAIVATHQRDDLVAFGFLSKASGKNEGADGLYGESSDKADEKRQGLAAQVGRKPGASFTRDLQTFQDGVRAWAEKPSNDPTRAQFFRALGFTKPPGKEYLIGEDEAAATHLAAFFKLGEAARDAVKYASDTPRREIDQAFLDAIGMRETGTPPRYDAKTYRFEAKHLAAFSSYVHDDKASNAGAPDEVPSNRSFFAGTVALLDGAAKNAPADKQAPAPAAKPVPFATPAPAAKAAPPAEAKREPAAKAPAEAQPAPAAKAAAPAPSQKPVGRIEAKALTAATAPAFASYLAACETQGKTAEAQALRQDAAKILAEQISTRPKSASTIFMAIADAQPAQAGALLADMVAAKPRGLADFIGDHYSAPALRSSGFADAFLGTGRALPAALTSALLSPSTANGHAAFAGLAFQLSLAKEDDVTLSNQLLKTAASHVLELARRGEEELASEVVGSARPAEAGALLREALALEGKPKVSAQQKLALMHAVINDVDGKSDFPFIGLDPRFTGSLIKKDDGSFNPQTAELLQKLASSKEATAEDRASWFVAATNAPQLVKNGAFELPAKGPLSAEGLRAAARGQLIAIANETQGPVLERVLGTLPAEAAGRAAAEVLATRNKPHGLVGTHSDVLVQAIDKRLDDATFARGFFFSSSATGRTFDQTAFARAIESATAGNTQEPRNQLAYARLLRGAARYATNRSGPEIDAMREALNTELHTALRRLPVDDRRAFLLKDLLPVDETALEGEREGILVALMREPAMRKEAMRALQTGEITAEDTRAAARFEVVGLLDDYAAATKQTPAFTGTFRAWLKEAPQSSAWEPRLRSIFEPKANEKDYPSDEPSLRFLLEGYYQTLPVAERTDKTRSALGLVNELKPLPV